MHCCLALKVLVGLLLAGGTLIVLASKCLFLAPCRAGWLMMAANVVYEALGKKLHWRRWWVDAAAIVLLCLGWFLLAKPFVAAAVGVGLGLAWAYAQAADLAWRSGRLTCQDRAWSATGPEGIRSFIPLPLPRLVLLVQGPALRRDRLLDLGDWPEGNEDRFDILILNPSLVAPQYPMTVDVRAADGSVEVLDAPPAEHKAPDPGKLVRLGFRLRAARPGPGPCRIRVTVRHRAYSASETLLIRSVIPREQARVASAEIRRWKGGAAAGFAWRGDHDLFDAATFQSAEGLRMALALSNRFHLPSTIYLSARLSLLEDEHRQFCRHFGFDRRTEQIPGFIRFLREDCELRAEMEFPHESPRPFFAELASHMFLHYGTHAAACPENDWTLRARPGQGRYTWQMEPGSFAEQRDNARKNSQVIREVLGVEMINWGSPGGANDADTPAALEAAGMTIASGSDATKWNKIWRLAPPHHPAGAERLVELTTKYPGDCDDAYKLAMTRYWMHAARRTGRVYVLLHHHHLLLYQGWACYRLTEELLRHLLADCHGDFHVATISALGLYWERVLCPRHRCVRIECQADHVRVRNTGDADLCRLPLEIDLGGGRRFAKLIDVRAGGEVAVRVP